MSEWTVLAVFMPRVRCSFFPFQTCRLSRVQALSVRHKPVAPRTELMPIRRVKGKNTKDARACVRVHLASRRVNEIKKKNVYLAFLPSSDQCFVSKRFGLYVIRRLRASAVHTRADYYNIMFCGECSETISRNAHFRSS